MRRIRVLTGTVLAASALVLLPAPAATGHVHGLTPLGCTPAPANAGANQTNVTPAAAANGGPLSGVIPRGMSGKPTLEGGADAAVCAQ